MRAFLIAAGIAVALFMAPEASAQIGGVQGISSAQGKAAGRTSQLQINIVFDPVSVAPANFPGSSNITEAQFKAAVAEAVANFQAAFFVKANPTIEIYWIPGGSSFFGGCTIGLTNLGESCFFLNNFASWSALVSALNANAVTTNAKSAVTNLPVSNPLPGGVVPWATYPQLVAFGLQPSGGSGNPDAAIAISSGQQYTPTQNGGAGPIAAGTYDLVGAIMHELREDMGGFRYAGTDNPFYLSMDAMAYSAPGTLNFTSTGTAYFSVDGGVTNINTFNQNTSGDLGDWSGLTHSPFNNVDATGQLNVLQPGDIKNLDALGWQCGSC